jgi:hypothetical protein
VSYDVLRYDSVSVRYDVLGYWSDRYAMMHVDQRSVTRESDLSKGKAIIVNIGIGVGLVGLVGLVGWMG